MKLFLFTLAIVAAHTAYAEIHYVSLGMSVQEAVNEAAPGDSIVLEDGLHSATVVPYGKDVAIGSRYLLDGDTTHVTATVVEPDYNRPDTMSCFVYAYGETPASRLVGLRLANGRGTAYIHTNDNPCGGAVYVVSTESLQANVSMDHCRIEFGRALQGGGVFIRGWGSPTSVVMDHCTIYGCFASMYGGGIMIGYGILEARNCVFEAVTLDTGAFPMAGTAILASDSHVILDSCEFAACAGTDATVAIAPVCTGTVSHCSFHNNVILYGMGAGEADLLVTLSYMTIYGCHFYQNWSGSPAATLSGWAPYSYSFVGNVVENGVATLFTGAICLAGNRGDVGYNIIRNYVNGHGGTINSHVDGQPDPQVRIHHNTITGNVSLDPEGPSVLTTVDLWPQLDSNQISGNSGNTIGPNPNYPEGIINARNNWWGDPSGPYHPTQNPGGQGDTLLSDSVLFIPWLTEPPDTTMPPNYLSVREPTAVARTWELMEVYPNPLNQSVTLVLAGFAGADFEIALYNLLGQQVDVIHRGPLTGGQIIYQASPHLASGVYLLSARDRHSVQTKKVVLLK